MYVSLHTHSEYSILDALPSVEALASRAATYGMPALALTDHGNLFGAVDFAKACKEAKIKPIFGCELYVAPGARHDKQCTIGNRTDFHLTLLAKNSTGYHNLCKLSSIGYIEGFYYHPRIDFEALKQHHEGLICLSGCLSSRISYEILNGNPDGEIARMQELFGEDFYLELQRQVMTQEEIRADGYHKESWLLQQYEERITRQQKVNDALIKISREKNIKVVATPDVHYLDRDDWRVHEILLNVQSGEPCEIWEKDSLGNNKQRIPNPKRRVYPTHAFDFTSPEVMKARFSDIPEALTTSLEIAEKCNVAIDFKSKHYPRYTPPDSKTVEEYLLQLCEEGIPRRYTEERLAKVQEKYPERKPMDVIAERLAYEMSVIAPKGMCDYLLIVWDFINWGKRQNIPFGPGRGSGAGSIILYLIGITDIEPLRFNLFFERFINPDRISYPDIDVDICMSRRQEVIQYTLEKYGKDNVAQIITFGTMKARMAIRDVGRVLNIPLLKVNAIVKLVPEELDITIDKALEKDAELRKLYEEEEDTRRIIDLAKKLEGTIRNTGIHAAGLIICGEPLATHVPLCTAKDSDMPVTQFSMKPAEMVGMLKIDFLGLKNLTCIQLCADSIEEIHGIKIDWINLSLEDAGTFEILNQGKTLGIFQMESGGMQDLARQLHLDKFEEVIAVLSLYRPGPMDMIPSFISRKHGREPIENDHPWMKDILAETYGIMVYQEQVMQIASKLANFTLGEGDVLRRAMGKKDAEQMAQMREKFTQGALQNDISNELATHIFDKMERFAAYGFNKSHAAAYGYVTYVTAYFKAHYPKEWMAALLTCDRDDIAKVAKFIRECQAMGITLLPPDVNEACSVFTATPAGIRFAMTGIKGIGEGVVEAIIQERKKGSFKSLYDFVKRIDTKKSGKKTIEGLIEAGCFDFTTWSRDALRESLDPIFDAAAHEQKEAASGMLSLFAKLGDSDEARFSKPPRVRLPTQKLQQLFKEKELLGFFLTGHPLDGYQEMLKRLSCVPLHKIDEMSHDDIFRAAFLIETVQFKISNRTQKKFAILSISDGLECYELPVWPELCEEKGHLLRENQLLYAVIQIDKKEGLRLSCRWMDDLTQANDAMMDACDQAFDKAKHQAVRFAKRPPKAAVVEEAPKPDEPLQINLDAEKCRLSHVLKLKKLFEANRGITPVHIQFQGERGLIATLSIDSKWGVQISPQLKQALQGDPYV